MNSVTDTLSNFAKLFNKYPIFLGEGPLYLLLLTELQLFLWWKKSSSILNIPF